MTYFENTDYLSNSDLKRLYKRAGYSFEEPVNLDRVFEFGTLFHNCLLEPLKVNFMDPDLLLAQAMVKTFYKDQLCHAIMRTADLRVEHEYYREDVFEFRGKCKADGKSNELDLIFELKGLSVETQRAFDEAVDRFDYDQGAAWYIHAAHKKRVFIVAVSKKNPNQLFKTLINEGDKIYNRGVDKVLRVKRIVNELVGDLKLDMNYE
jgi:hypothetical protein